MGRISLLIALVVIIGLNLLVFGPSNAISGEKVNLGTALKMTPLYYLPISAAQEKGFWKKAGIEVEWFPFEGTSAMNRALAGGSIPVGIEMGFAVIPALARGLPGIIVGELLLPPSGEIYVDVLAGSPIKEPKDLKGAKIGVSRLGSAAHVHGQFIVKKLGLEKDVKFVATGGLTTTTGLLKRKSIDATLNTLFPVLELRVKGEIRSVMRVDDYLPKKWLVHVIVAHRDFAKSDPATLKSVIKGLLNATDFLTRNSEWAIQKMKSMQGYSPEAANLAWQNIRFSRDAKVDREAVENVREFIIENDIIPKEKMPPADRLYTNEFIE